MNLFDNIICSDFNILLNDIGKSILINGTPTKAIINNIEASSGTNWLDDKKILGLQYHKNLST